MAVNKNFVVKNGLEVGTDLILANTTNSRVGIGTSLPTDTLHVNGGIAGTDFVISGIATIPTLNSTTGTITNLSATTISMGSTAIVNSARQLQNIASLDATTTATIESAIEAGPNTFANLNITGVSTFVGLATFGSGLEVQSGVSTFAGLVDINGGATANTLNVEDLTSGRVVYAGGSGELQDDPDLTFDGSTLTVGNLQVAGVTTSTGLIDANGGVSISGGSGLQVTGAATVSTTLGVTGNSTLTSAVIGGVSTHNNGGIHVTGVVTATAFHGDISNTTGISTNFTASVGIQSGGTVVGAGITTLNFIGAGNSVFVNGSNAGIVDISIAGGGGAGAATSVGGNAPVDAKLGQLWYSTDYARTFIFYDEDELGIGSTSYWVDAAPFDAQDQFLSKTGDNMNGALGISSGTLAAPGLYINGSTNTGIAQLKPNEFSFVSTGTEKFNVNATGARIVGTTTVTGNINAVDGVFTGNVTVGGTLTKQDVTNVDSVGVITARGGSIVVIGDANPTYQVKTGSTSRLKIIADTGNNKVVISSQEGYPLALGAASGGGISEALRIDTNGRVGIGTISNATTDTFLQVTNPAAHTEVVITSKSDSGALINFGDLDDYNIGRIKYDNVTDSMQFQTNNGERVRIASNGNVKIGSGSPNLAVGNGLEIDTGGAATIRLEDSGAGSGFEIQNTGGVIKQRLYNGQSWVIEHGSGEKFRVASSGQIGIAGANYGTAGQVIKSGGSGASVAWGDTTLGISSGGSSIGNATTLNFIGAGNTFVMNGSTVDISISGGGGGSGDFNTGLTGEFFGTAVGIGSTVFTFPSTAGKKYILRSLLATNVSTANTDVNVIGAIDFNGGERSYIGYNLPVPVGMAAELLRQPQVLNPSDKILLRSTDINRNGTDSIIEYYGTYELVGSGAADYAGVGLGTATLSSTSATTLYTSSGAASVLQSIRIANVSDAGPKPISVSITSGSDVVRLVENLIVPKYGSIEILDNQKRIASGAIVKVTLDEAGTMGVQLSAKKIAAV